MMNTYASNSESETGEQEIFYAEAPDLISSLLSFDSNELAGGYECPEDMVVHKTCELKGWKVEGQHPRFLVEHWIEVVVTGQQQGYCRILNSRAHTHLTPFTIDSLMQQFGQQIKWLKQHEIHPDFVAWLLAAYDELADETGKDVGLHDLFRLINTRQPNYRREAFGIDLSNTLAGSAVLEGRRVRLGYAEGPLTHRYALCLSKHRSAQIADRIRIDAALASLDI